MVLVPALPVACLLTIFRHVKRAPECLPLSGCRTLDLLCQAGAERLCAPCSPLRPPHVVVCDLTRLPLSLVRLWLPSLFCVLHEWLGRSCVTRWL